MYVLSDVRLADFDFWCGARGLADKLTSDEFDIIESYLDDITGGANPYMTETDINDFFWFEDEIIAEILGFEDSEALWDELLTR